MDATTQSLRLELDAALAELEEATTLGEINQTLVDMLEVLKQRKAAAPPQVTVNVSPTPIAFTPPTHDLEFTFAYDANGRIKSSRMTRVKG